jgi:trimeric autotransporter adhesin
MNRRTTRRPTHKFRRGKTLKILTRFLAVAAALGATTGVMAQVLARTDPAKLEAARLEAESRWQAWQGPDYLRVKADLAGPTTGANLELVGVTASGHPLYLGTDNLVAAATVGASRTWPGGDLGLGLTGANGPRELAVWDAGSVRATHQEFGGRVTLRDPETPLNFHSTHVAGTLIASGVQPAAHGMSPAGLIDSYDWQQDDEEMIAAAGSGMLLSNHSYAYLAGWNYDESQHVWYWYGDVTISPVEDYGFGLYHSITRAWDQIAVAAPYYLICQAAGNDRNHWGPGPNGGHYYYDPDTGWTWSTAFRQADGADGGYDTISYRGNAKNVLTIGAVADIPGGYHVPGDVVMTEFSGWGPTDDGRIKPDLVANGVELYSTMDGSDTDYASLTGTSMAGPNATGSLNLLVQQYRAAHGGALMRAATLKALALQTADEAGAAPGPDYSHGWGLLDVAEAALVIADDATTPGRLLERALASGPADTLRFLHDDAGPVRATICWTDPAGPVSADVLDPTTRRLVNDLDLRLVRAADGQVTRPWVLDPAVPAAAATTGDNDRDNVERIDLNVAPAGEYLLLIDHEGALSGSQAYSLAVTGLRQVPQSTGVDDAALPSPLRVAALPNPFNPQTSLGFSLAQAQTVSLVIHALDGHRVATLLAGAALPAGDHRVTWNGRADDGRALPSAIYLARLVAGDRTATTKLVLAK